MSLFSEHEIDTPSYSVTRKKIKLLLVNDNEELIKAFDDNSELINHLYDFELKHVKEYNESLKGMNEWCPNTVIINLNSLEIDIFNLLERWKDGIATVHLLGETYSPRLEQIFKSLGANEYFVSNENFDEIYKILEIIGKGAKEDVSLH